jgi:outer membrane protein assembly factor BamB
MLVSHFAGRTQDPWQAPQLLALKERLLASPQDEPLKEQIRSLDLQLRGRYFHQLSLNRSGAWLLLCSAGVFILSATQLRRARASLPMPQPNPIAGQEHARFALRSRWSVAALGTTTALACLSIALTSKPLTPGNSVDLEKLLSGKGGAGVTADYASLQEMQQNWPRFRGAMGAGISTVTNLPLAWDAKSGKGILWKTELRAPGFNSPVVWRERVFISGADSNQRRVFCYTAGSGAILWEGAVENVPGSPPQPPTVPEQTGYAASTVATDGCRVYAIFANGDLAAFTLEGQPVWAKNLGTPKNPHGHASSLVTWDGRLLVQLDQGEAEQNRSRLFAFDGRTGRTMWERTRSVPASWATPIVIEAAGKPQVITLGVPWVIAYAAADGAELWRAEGLNNEVTPSAVFAGGLVLAVSPNEKLLAIRPDGQGDVTKTHIAWEAEDNIPDISSPVSDGQLAFTLSTPGMLTCFDAKDGKKVWEQDLAMECNASPSIAGNRLYLVSTKGVVVVADAGRAFKELARSEMDENIYASSAFVGSKIYFRGVKHLFCVGGEQSLAKAE